MYVRDRHKCPNALVALRTQGHLSWLRRSTHTSYCFRRRDADSHALGSGFLSALLLVYASPPAPPSRAHLGPPGLYMYKCLGGSVLWSDVRRRSGQDERARDKRESGGVLGVRAEIRSAIETGERGGRSVMFLFCILGSPRTTNVV